MRKGPDFGAFVISLDFERYWGVRDVLASSGSYRNNLLGESEAITEILSLFAAYDVAATWATVGYLFADSKSDLDRYQPSIAPAYSNPQLLPKESEFADASDHASLSFAPELIDLIRNTPRQEIATHTFSHYYCLEEGQTARSFEADILSAVAIAEKKSVKFKSIVFPRNQHNPHYDRILLDQGITCYRGNQDSWMYQFDGRTQTNPLYRAARLADTYLNVSGLNTYRWSDIWRDGIANVRASMFLRPVPGGDGLGPKLQYRRITRSLEFAARNKQIFHLWWHPHNFGSNLKQNIEFLKGILERFREMHSKYEMRSLTMAETAEAARNDLRPGQE